MIGLGTPDLLGKHKHIVEIAMYPKPQIPKKNSALWKIISDVHRLKKLLLGVSVGNY